MEAHLASMQPIKVNKITTSCEICSGPHDTQYCMEDSEQAFVEYASSCTNKTGSRPCTMNQGPRSFNEAVNAWKEKLLEIKTEEEGSVEPIKTKCTNRENENETDEEDESEKEVEEETEGEIKEEEEDDPKHFDTSLTIKELRLEPRRKPSNPKKNCNFVGRVKGLRVFIGNFTYECDFMKHGLVSKTYYKKSLIMASTFGSNSKSFMTMSIPSQDEPLTNRPVEIETEEEGSVEPIKTKCTNRENANETDESEKEVEEETKVEIEEEEEDDPKHFDTSLTMKELRLEPRRKPSNPKKNFNFVGRVKGLRVFIGNFTYECDFMVLEDTTSVIDHYLGSVVFGNPFMEATELVYNKEKGTVVFERDKERIIFKITYKIDMFKHIDFTDRGTDSIPPLVIESDDDKCEKTHCSDSLSRARIQVIFDKKKLGRS
nr:retrotransposon Orf1 [Tanacetum cinerariifolium]